MRFCVEKGVLHDMPDAALATMLTYANLSHIEPQVANETFTSLEGRVQRDGHDKFLAFLQKTLGIRLLADRQAVYSALKSQQNVRDGDTALIDAVRHDDYNRVAGLLAKRVSVDEANKDGHTPLMIGCHTGGLNHIAIVKMLLDAGAAADQLDQHGNPLLLGVVAGAGHVSLASHLLEAHAPVDRSDVSGRTPLYYACSLGRLDMVQLLVPHGASLSFNVSTKHGPVEALTAEQLAKRLGRTDVLSWLKALPPKLTK